MQFRPTLRKSVCPYIKELIPVLNEANAEWDKSIEQTEGRPSFSRQDEPKRDISALGREKPEAEKRKCICGVLSVPPKPSNPTNLTPLIDQGTLGS